MKLIIGLGNPGKEYQYTRHNVGFMAIDYIVLKLNGSFKSKFDGLYYETQIDEEKVIFLKPQKFINLSGEIVKKYMDFYKIDVDNIFVIHDDLDLDMGTFKLRLFGGSAGHNGLKNIENCLCTKNYKRCKIGISNDKSIDGKNYVLGRFSKKEKMAIERIISIMPELIKDYLKMSFDNLMNKYNFTKKED